MHCHVNLVIYNHETKKNAIIFHMFYDMGTEIIQVAVSFFLNNTLSWQGCEWYA